MIEPRRSVQRAAVLVHDADVFELADVLGALEHHVLEQMRKARPVLRLDAEADAIHHLDDHDGRCMVLTDDDTQAVRQLAVDDGDGERRGGRSAWRLCGRRGHRQRGETDGEDASAHKR